MKGYFAAAATWGEGASRRCTEARRAERAAARARGRAHHPERPAVQRARAHDLHHDDAASRAAGQRAADQRRGGRELPHPSRRDARADPRDAREDDRRPEARRDARGRRRRRSGLALSPARSPRRSRSSRTPPSRRRRWSPRCRPARPTHVTSAARGSSHTGVSAAPTSIEEIRAGHGAHGPDERRPVKWFGPAATFLRGVVLEVAK